MKRNIGAAAAVLVILAGTIGAEAATVAYWRFETDSGAPVTNGQAVVSVDDISGNGWSLTNTTGVCKYTNNTYFADPVPQTRAANPYMVKFSASPLANSAFNATLWPKPFTIEMFVHVPNYNCSLFTLGNLQVMFYSANLSLRWGATPWFGGHNTGAGTVSNNTTHHVAVVFEGGLGYYRLYLDGVDVDDVGAKTEIAGVALGDVWENNFSGSLDEVRISDVALTTNQFLNCRVPPPSGTIISLR